MRKHTKQGYRYKADLSAYPDMIERLTVQDIQQTVLDLNGRMASRGLTLQGNPTMCPAIQADSDEEIIRQFKEFVSKESAQKIKTEGPTWERFLNSFNQKSYLYAGERLISQLIATNPSNNITTLKYNSDSQRNSKYEELHEHFRLIEIKNSSDVHQAGDERLIVTSRSLIKEAGKTQRENKPCADILTEFEVTPTGISLLNTTIEVHPDSAIGKELFNPDAVDKAIEAEIAAKQQNPPSPIN